MPMRNASTALATAAVVAVGFAAGPRGERPGPPADAANTQTAGECTVNLGSAGTMRDIVSNALLRGIRAPEKEVAAFLEGAESRYDSGPALLKAAAAHFKLGEEILSAKVEKYKHANCTHPVPSLLHPLLQTDPQPNPACTVNFELAGNMRDIVSNALTQGIKAPERDVKAFCAEADAKCDDGPELFKAAAARFNVSEDALAAEVLKFKHCNCTHTGGGESPEVDDGAPVSAFAKDVTLHVVLHELGHALIREFDIPVLGNEETVADAFATYYLTTHLPDRAPDVLQARVTSLMIEAGEALGPGAKVDWSGEHDHDARRANQIAALAVAADPVKYKHVAAVVGMSESDIRKAVDYGGELRRSWRRVLAPLWMPEGTASDEARVEFDENNGFLKRVCSGGLASEIETAVRKFDWHSQVTVRFVDARGGAGWNRSSRTITVNSSYVRRFKKQGEQGLAAR